MLGCGKEAILTPICTVLAVISCHASTWLLTVSIHMVKIEAAGPYGRTGILGESVNLGPGASSMKSCQFP